MPRWPWAAVLALVIAVAAGLGVWLMEAGTPARAQPGLAVLPFTNFTGGEAGGRLADGITGSPAFVSRRFSVAARS